VNRIIFVPIALLAASCGQHAVTGVVLDIRGQPLALAQVRIGTLPPATTDGNGRFSVDGAPETYDAAVVAQIPGSQFLAARTVAIAYVGLTRRDPTLWLPIERAPASFFGAASFSVSGIPGSGCALYVLIDGSGNRHSQKNALDRTCSGGPLSVMPWYGTTSGAGSLVALSLGGTQGIAASGHIAVKPNDGGGPPVTVPVSPAEALVVQGSTAVPAGCFLQERGIIVPGLQSDSGAVLPSQISGAPFTFDVGWTAEAPLALVARARCDMSATGAQRRIRRDTTSYVLDLPSPPVLTVPTAVNPTAPYSWTGPAGSIGLLRFDHFDPNGSLATTVFVLTSARSASLPDIGGLAGAPPADLGYGASVEVWDGLRTTDAAAAGDGLAALASGLIDSNYGSSTLEPSNLVP
jgi:hypothetical protein